MPTAEQRFVSFPNKYGPYDRSRIQLAMSYCILEYNLQIWCLYLRHNGLVLLVS